MLLLLLLPTMDSSTTSITKQVGILPVRVVASCASAHCSGLVCAWAFGFPGSWDLDLLLACHTQVLACVEKGASCNSNDADDAQVIITAAKGPWPLVAAQPKQGPSPWPHGTQYGIHPSQKAKGKRYAPRGGCDVEPTPQSVLARP